MSSVRTQVEEVEQVEPDNDWTIMIFFAGDPHLSPSMTAQLKSFKDAGFQDNTTVLVHYDPNEKGVATTTFDINRTRKVQRREELEKEGKNKAATIIGDGKDPYVRNLLEDSITGGASRTDNAEQALRAFLDIGATRYPAKHYIISLVGHGVIVGNDVFLPDHQPESGITLGQLGDILRHFNLIIPKNSKVELLGMHSCSMSAIEVLYELKDTARYMMATEGVSFVTSWPYRQLMKKVLNAIANTRNDDVKGEEKTKVDVDGLIKSFHDLALHNSTDFIFSGLSADLCLCRLEKDPIEALNDSLKKLTTALKKGMEDPPRLPGEPEYPRKEARGLELIKLAHLEAQSYWQETYTDLYDFCLCLERRCDITDPVQQAMADACKVVREKLKESPAAGSLIVQSDHVGPLFQYSHGLSIFFPWSRPVQEEPLILNDDILTRYEQYEFTKALGRRDSWLSFLEEYFAKTKRDSRDDEDNDKKVRPNVSVNGTRFSRTFASGIGTSNIGNGESLEKGSGALEKGSGALNGGCGCSVKNYPMEVSLSLRASKDANRNRAASTTPSNNGVGLTTKAKTEATSRKTTSATTKTNGGNKTGRRKH